MDLGLALLPTATPEARRLRRAACVLAPMADRELCRVRAGAVTMDSVTFALAGVNGYP